MKVYNCAVFNNYPVPALLYDAKRGNTHSRRQILTYHAYLLENGHAIPRDIAKFVAELLRAVLEGRQDAAAMFNPEGTKTKVIQSWPADIYARFNLDGDIKAKFTWASKRFGLSRGAIEKRYLNHRDYKHRIDRIQELLDEGATAIGLGRKKAIVAQLQRLTAIVS